MQKKKITSRDIKIITIAIIAFAGIYFTQSAFNTTNYPKTKTKTETPKAEKKQNPVTITYDTLYVIRTQYTYSHHLIQSLCVNTHGQVVTCNCSDFTEPGDTLIIITKSNKWHSDEINITRDRIINRYTKQR